MQDAGAATWMNGAASVGAVVGPLNSLVGSTASDLVGYYLTALSNGSYVASSPYWDNGLTIDVGAATWGNGLSGAIGPVSLANSLVGSTAGDQVGFGVTVLENGNYVVSSPKWDNGTAADAGAVTWGNGVGGVAGKVSGLNSLVGSQSGDSIGTQITALENGNYVMASPYWDNGPAVDAGAITWGYGASGTFGPVSPEHSVTGAQANGFLIFKVDSVNHQLVVGRPADQIVTLFDPLGKPTNFTKSSPANGFTGFPTRPVLSWGGSSGATHYEYCYYSTNPVDCDGDWFDAGLLTSVTLSGLTSDTTYHWQVRASNADGTTLADTDAWWSFRTGKYFMYQPMMIK